ncbi:peptidylprolyl isomerase [Allorhizobium sp. BGMRC 0089]|uniref:FKBP-type peptidyl-prolyl cis-trans isomerase n=1 Tax=Allorhizobium sonneratiae TaxID=2934936 RepID=UPI0020347173|nr:peptidylprolyl isomerase [Allorhizobium sonneratiae]MCM2291484.1 peptidylprolyl isomerase [Allorhizobium sonneratiae]
MANIEAHPAKAGDTVLIHYVGLLPDGTPFDSSRGREPLKFQLGSGRIIPGLDRQVSGMAVGDSQRITVPAHEAYGPHDPQKVQRVARDVIPANINLAPGTQLQAQSGNGAPMVVTVTEVKDDSVTIDANHPLAGQDLIFEVELVEIVQAA